uniref:recombinase family protein n=1 Tax=Acidithrix sp. C25 TaxID=1671482 RepID=UPI0032DE5DFB
MAYARVSTNAQKDDLVRQVALLESYCAANGWSYEIISDVGSGLNYHKRGLKVLISWICSGEVGRLVLSHNPSFRKSTYSPS